MPHVLLATLLSIFLLTPVSFAHGNHDDAAEDFVHIYETLTEVLGAHLHSVPEKVEFTRANNRVYINLNGHKVALNKSAMHQLMTLATLRYDVRHLHDNPAMLKKALAFIGGVFAAIPTKIYQTARHPVLTVSNLTLAVEAYAHRLSHSFSPGIFVVIAVSQGAWEALESAIMPAGVHLACTIFNGALLMTVVPIERVGEFSSFSGSGLPFRERIRLTLKAMALQARGVLGTRGKHFHDLPDATFAIDKRSIVIRERSQLEDLLKEWGFSDAVYLTRTDPNDTYSSPAPTLQSDLDFVFNTSFDPLERFYVAFAHMRGLALLQDVLEHATSHARSHQWLRRNEWLPLERTVGRLRKIHSLYSTSLLMLAASETPVPESESITKAMSKTLHDLINQHHELASLLDKLHHTHDHPHGGHHQDPASDADSLRVYANQKILQAENNSRQLKAHLTAMRSSSSYSEAIGKWIGQTYRSLCHMAFGGKPL